MGTLIYQHSAIVNGGTCSSLELMGDSDNDLSSFYVINHDNSVFASSAYAGGSVSYIGNGVLIVRCFCDSDSTAK